MRAVTIRDGSIFVEEHPDPTSETGELLVRVKAAGLNGADMMQLAGRYPAPPGAPQDIPGLELAGEVAEVGRDARRFEPGDRVMAVVAGGGQAELAVVHERLPNPTPDALDWGAGGGGPGGRTGPWCTSGSRSRSRTSSTGRPPAACRRASPSPTTPSSPRPGSTAASGC